MIDSLGKFCQYFLTILEYINFLEWKIFSCQCFHQTLFVLVNIPFLFYILDVATISYISKVIWIKKGWVLFPLFLSATKLYLWSCFCIAFYIISNMPVDFNGLSHSNKEKAKFPWLRYNEDTCIMSLSPLNYSL